MSAAKHKSAAFGHVMEVRRYVNAVERLLDSDAAYDAVDEAEALVLEAARLLGEVCAFNDAQDKKT